MNQGSHILSKGKERKRENLGRTNGERGAQEKGMAGVEGAPKEGDGAERIKGIAGITF